MQWLLFPQPTMLISSSSTPDLIYFPEINLTTSSFEYLRKPHQSLNLHVSKNIQNWYFFWIQLKVNDIEWTHTLIMFLSYYTIWYFCWHYLSDWLAIFQLSAFHQNHWMFWAVWRGTPLYLQHVSTSSARPTQR